MFRFLLATDGSEHSEKILEKIISLAVPLKAEITVISVAEVPKPFELDFLVLTREKILKYTREILEKTAETLREKGLAVKTILGEGHPAEVICKEAEEGKYDLVVLGSRGLGKIEELLLGSVSSRVAHCSKISVLIVK